MEKINVIIEWASDGGVTAMMENDLFAGQGDTVEEAVKDMREGVKFFIATAKEMGFPYKEYLDCDYDVDLQYDIKSILEYVRKFMTDAGLAKLTGINPQQIGRYASGNAAPREIQKRKILEALQKFGSTFSAISL
ncbi:MAG: helix-turn-helix transcriptional regulator [Tannerellaceae bacterium]|nr:helix-turn-helix transcriptional regulator [Tannerellaceae bacterium]